MRHSDGNIIVTTQREQLIYPHSSVRKFTLSNEHVTQGGTTEIATMKLETQLQRQGDILMFTCCVPNETIALYDIAGNLLQQYSVAADGTLHIPLQIFTAGLYIVKTRGITYKFIKK